MRKLFVTVLAFALLAIVPECMCQKILIGARDEFNVSIGYNFPMGPKNIGNDFSLLSNMKSGPSIEGRYMTQLSRKLSAGIWGGTANFDDWNVPENSLYKGTSMSFLSFGPSVTYKPLSLGKSIRRFNFCVTLSPGISRIAVKTSEDSEINGEPTTDPLSIQSLRFTVGIHAGLNYVINNSFGIALRGGYQYTIADSQIFPDESFAYVNSSLGVFCRLFKDKKYKYSGL